MTHLRQSRCFNRCSFRVIILAFLWTASFIIGAVCTFDDIYTVSMMRRAISCPVSIVGLFAVLILPLLISVLALLFRKLTVIYIFTAIKAYFSGATICAVCAAFRYAGWLVRLLLLFSDTVISVLVLLLLIRHIDGVKASFWRDVLVCFIAVTICGCIDYLQVTPFLMSLAGHI